MDFGFGAKGWAAYDCSDGPTVCAVAVRPPGRGHRLPQVLAAAEVEREALPSDAEALRGLVGAMPRGLQPLLTLPRSQYQLRVMPEPAVPPREMVTSLRWTLSTEFETGFDDLSLAWMRIPTEQQQPLKPKQIYVVMASKAVMAQRVAQCRQAGIKPKVVDIRETGLRNLCSALERDDEGLGLVSVDASGVHMVFTHRGALYLDRSIDLRLADVLAADAAGRQRHFERVADQMGRSVDMIARNFGFMAVQRVVVAPEAQPLGLFQVLAARLGLAVVPLQLGEVFDLSRVPDLAQSPALQARCLVALGAALRPARAVQ